MSENKKINIILIRHAKSAHQISAGAVFAGSMVDAGITETGEKEARELATRLANQGQIDFILSSKLKRSMQTANIIATEVLKQTKKEILVMNTPEIAEMDFGKFSGHNVAWVKERYPEEYRTFSIRDLEEFNFPDGEKYSDMIKRIRRLLKKISRLNKGKVLIVGHAVFNRIFLSYLFPQKPDLWKKDDFPHERIDNFSLNINDYA